MSNDLEVICKLCDTYVPGLVDVSDMRDVWPVTECCAWCAHKLETDVSYLEHVRSQRSLSMVPARLVHRRGVWVAEVVSPAGTSSIHRAASNDARLAWAALGSLMRSNNIAPADDATRVQLRGVLAKVER